MYRNTILKRVDCDMKALPLGAVEAFVLSQIDGRMTLEEIATITALEFAETAKIATRLRELGAAETEDARPIRRTPLRALAPEKKAPPARAKSTRPQAVSALSASTISKTAQTCSAAFSESWRAI